MSKDDYTRSGEVFGHLAAKAIKDSAKGEDLGRDGLVGAAIAGIPLAALALVGGAGILGAAAVGGIFAGIGGFLGYCAGEEKQAEKRADD